MRIEPGTTDDVAGIVSILRANLDDPYLFQRSLRDVERHLQDFCVARAEGGSHTFMPHAGGEV